MKGGMEKTKMRSGSFLSLVVALGISLPIIIESAYAESKAQKGSMLQLGRRVEKVSVKVAGEIPDDAPPCGGDPSFVEARTYEALYKAFTVDPSARVKLCNDIDAHGATLTPLGWKLGQGDAVDISGILDGLGHEIRNFVISPFDGERQDRAGLVNVTALIPKLTGVDATHPAVVRNLTLRNGQMPWTNRADIAYGLLAGAVTNALIEDVKIIDSNIGESYGSGLLAYSIRSGTIRRIELSGRVGHARDQNADFLGGLAAFLEGGAIEDVRLNVLVDNGRLPTTGRYAGGMIGQMSGGTIRKVRGSATVYSASSGAGGLVGDLEHNAPITLENIRLTVDVGNGTIPIVGQLPPVAGGLVGTSFAQALTMRDIRINGSVGALDSAGGIIGGFLADDDSFLERAQFTGTVRANYSGGLVGWRQFGPVHIRNAFARANLTGSEAAGGIIGRNLEQDLGGAYGAYLTTIENTYFVGTLAADSVSESGGIVGEDAEVPAATIISSYYDGLIATRPSNGTGVQSDTFTMQHDPSLYAGWDFVNVWKFNVGDYPILRNLVSVADFNMDGRVTVQDLFAFLAAFFARDPAADLDHDGTVSMLDLYIFIQEFLDR